MDVGDYISAGLSLFAIVLTIAMYIKHDKKLKKQEEKLNNYQLKKIEKEEVENKQAYIIGEIRKGTQGRRDLIITNKGKSPAKNICTFFLNNSDEKIIIQSKNTSFELLNPNENLEIIMYLHTCKSTDIFKVKWTWEDDFSCQREHIQHFTLT